MGGGGSDRSTSETSRIIPPELSGVYSALGNSGREIINALAPSMAGFMTDQTPQEIAGPTSLHNLAYRRQVGLLHDRGPEAWSQAQGMYGQLGNLPTFGGADFSNIAGWGAQPGGQTAAPQQGPAPQQTYDPYGGGQSLQSISGKSLYQGGRRPIDDGPGSGEQGEPGTGGGVASPYQSGGTAGSGGADGEGLLDPTKPTSGARGPVGTMPNLGGVHPRYSQADQGAGQQTANAVGQLGGPAGGQVREIDTSGFASGGGGGWGGNFSASGGGYGGVADEDRIESVLDKVDFANHPALQSALETFTKTSLPGIENQMIGAGLGRSGAAANAIATGKAQIALPVMQQLIQGELTQRGQDVTQRGQDVNANIAGAAQGAQMMGQMAGLRNQRYLGELSALQNLRNQDISLRGQDINAALQNAGMGLDARSQNINALLGGAQGLTNLGQADYNRITGDIGNAMQIGDNFRDQQNQINQSEFNARMRPAENFMNIIGMFAPGAMNQAGSRTVQTGGGGK
jgi:hypothetical protein